MEIDSMSLAEEKEEGGRSATPMSAGGLVDRGEWPGGRQLAIHPVGPGRRGLELVYLVDDDRAIAEMYRVGLEAAGFSVAVARDSVELFRAIEIQVPDFIVLDWELPGTHGDEVLHQIRLDARTKLVPVFMLSTFPPEVDGAIDRVFRDGALAWFEKSKTSPLLLAERLAEALSADPADAGDAAAS